MKIKFIKEYRAARDNSAEQHIYNVGDVYDYFMGNSAQWLIDNGFAEEVKESGWWKPKCDEEYFYIGHDSFVHPCLWQNDSLDNGRLRLGLVFKTEEAGICCRDYLEAIATVRQDEGVLTPNELQEKERDDKKVVFIGYDSMGHLATNPISLFSYDIVVNAIFFDNEMHAQSSLDNHRKEWETIANYDWSRE